MSYKCHHCDIFSSDLLKALEYKMQIFIDMNQKILIGGNILVFVNSKFWSMHLIWLYSYLKRTLIPVIIFLGNFWPKFLFILCKVHQEKKWWLNPITYFDYHSCTCDESINSLYWIFCDAKMSLGCTEWTRWHVHRPP